MGTSIIAGIMFSLKVQLLFLLVVEGLEDCHYHVPLYHSLVAGMQEGHFHRFRHKIL